MEFIGLVFLVYIAIKAPGLFLSLPARIHRERKERMIRRLGKERYLEMEKIAEQKAREKGLIAEARIGKADRFIRRAVFGQTDNHSSAKPL